MNVQLGIQCYHTEMTQVAGDCSNQSLLNSLCKLWSSKCLQLRNREKRKPKVKRQSGSVDLSIKGESPALKPFMSLGEIWCGSNTKTLYLRNKSHEEWTALCLNWMLLFFHQDLKKQINQNETWMKQWQLKPSWFWQNTLEPIHIQTRSYVSVTVGRRTRV